MREIREIRRYLNHHGYHRDLAGALALASFLVGFGSWAFALGLLAGGR